MPPRLSTSTVPALDSGWLVLAWIVGTPTAFSLIDSILNLPLVTPTRVVAVVVAGALAVDALRHGRRTPDPVGAWMLAFLAVMTAALAATTIQSSAATLRADVVLLVE